MDVEYSFPGSVTINLDHADLESMQQLGYTLDRAGFMGFESKTWVHLPTIEDSMISHVHDASADIDGDGDLHVRLSRGFMPPVEIGQDAIAARPGDVEHYLGKTGVILVQVKE